MEDRPAPSWPPVRGAVPLSRVAARTCARPGCPGPARATLSFNYRERRAWLTSLSQPAVPEHYDLCAGHADRTAPPHGWELVDDRGDVDGDERPTSEPSPDAASEHPTGRPSLVAEDTIAVLAAALGRDRVQDAGPHDADPRLFRLAAPPDTEDRASTW